MKKIFITFFYLLISLSYGYSQQDKEYTNFSDTTFHIKEIIVSTAQQKKSNLLKLEVPVKYLPVSTNQLSASLLEVRGITDIQQAARFLPGVRIRTTYGAFQQISIRGFDNSVIMIDGIRDERSSIDNSYPFMDLTSIESIELLKGPASVLYGQSAVGGIINITRKAPESRKSVSSKISYGSYNNKQATISMGGQLIGPVNYYGVVNYADQDGWRKNGNKRFSGYLALGSNIGKKGILDIRGGFNRDYYGTEIGLPDNMPADVYKKDGSLYLRSGEMQPNLDKSARYNNESDFFKNQALNLSAQYTHKFSESVKLLEKLSYTNDDINYFGTEQLTYLESNNPIYEHYYLVGNKKKYICLDTVQLTFPLRFSHMAQTINNQLEINAKIQSGTIKHNLLAGYSAVAFLRNSFSGYNLGTDVQGPGLYSKVSVKDPHSMGYMTSSFSKATIMKTYTHGFYLQDMIEINDKFKTLLAGRYDLFNYQRATTPALNGKREFISPNNDAFDKVSASAFTYRAGIVYLPHPSVSVYGSVGSFFKPYRTFYDENTIYIDSYGNEFNPEKNKEVFKPEKGYQVEIGSRYSLGNILEASASVFYIKKNNTTKNLANVGDIITVGNNSFTLSKKVVGQVGAMDSKGFDAEVTLIPLKELALTVGYGYTDARTREIRDNIYMDTDELKGKKSTYVPENTFYGYGNYQISKGYLKNLGFNISVVYMDKIYRNIKTNLIFPSYWTTDIGASYLLNNNVKLSVIINNLFDEVYYDQALGSQMVPSMPRNFMVSVSYNL